MITNHQIDNENFGSMGHHSQRHLNLQHQKDRYKQSHKRTVRETMNGIAALLKGEEEDVDVVLCYVMLCYVVLRSDPGRRGEERYASCDG